MPNQLFKYFQEVSWPTQLCLQAVNAATMDRVPWFHDADSITDRPVVRFTAVKSSNQNSMDSIDNDFAHNRILRSDCNNSLHMPQSWVVMTCAKNIQQRISKMTAQK